jgi:hypothetical protein
MTNVKMTIFTVLLGCCLVLPKAGGAILFDDGKTQNIDRPISDEVLVKDSFFGSITTVNLLSGGAIEYDLKVYDNSQVNIFDGTIGDDLSAYDSSHVDIYGGWLSNNLNVYNNSRVNVYDGTIGDDLSAHDNSQVYIYGGLINVLWTYHNSNVYISGGRIGGEICAYGDDSTITFVGSNFAINGASVEYGVFDTSGLDWVHGTLTGTLSSGDELNNEVYIYRDSHIVLIPEPATLFLLGLVAVILRSKQRFYT